MKSHPLSLVCLLVLGLARPGAIAAELTPQPIEPLFPPEAQVSPVPLTNLPPVACFSASATTGVAPLTVNFDATCSFDPDGYIYSLIWTFGDGAYGGNSYLVSHTYPAGTYTVTLTVNDNLGWIGQTSTTITVTATGGSGTGCPRGTCT